MKSYKDYLIEKGVPPGPWVTDGPSLTTNPKPKETKVLKFERKK